MPPNLASVLTLLFIVALFLWEHRKGEKASAALWLPVFWITITGSRFVGQWMNLGGNAAGGPTGDEGSFIDALYFSTLIVIGFAVLVRRRIFCAELVRNNLWMTAFFVYCLVSIIWSDYPFVAFKRYIKVAGHPLMALIILSDPHPTRALRIVMKRCAYVILPLSVLTIKYFPEIGRYYDHWTGHAYNRGIALNKNELGYGCMIFGLFFYWHLISMLRKRDYPHRLTESAISLVFLAIILWLLTMADSATSFATLGLGAMTITLLGLRIVNKRFLGTYAILAILSAAIIEATFGTYEAVVTMLGRDPSLTDRTYVWADALALVETPLLGAGFESFWLGPRLAILWDKWWWRPNQAHNGYIETYLNLGYIGVIILGGLIISTFRKIAQQSVHDLEFARLRMGFLIAIIVYNYTEATFKAVHLVWTMFHIIAIQYRPRGSADTFVSGTRPISEPHNTTETSTKPLRPSRKKPVKLN